MNTPTQIFYTAADNQKVSLPIPPLSVEDVANFLLIEAFLMREHEMTKLKETK